MLDAKPDPMIARDLVGYGAKPPNPHWPGGATIAVNFNLNIEGGGESSLINGDDVSEGMLNDIGVPAQRGVRVPLAESAFEYGSRRGAWRVLEAFAEFSVKMSILGVARALEQNPELAKACVAQGHEIVSHGYRWIDYVAVPEAVERDHIRRAVASLTALAGTRPVGWMAGRGRTHGGFSSKKAVFCMTAMRSMTSCPTGYTSAAGRILSFPIRTRQTTIAST